MTALNSSATTAALRARQGTRQRLVSTTLCLRPAGISRIHKRSGDGRPEVLAASEDGLVRVYAGDGTVRRDDVGTGAAARLLCVPAPGADAPVVVATEAGEVVAY